MIIDCHNHVLGSALGTGHKVFRRAMAVPGLRTAGQLPADRTPSEDDWVGLEHIWDSISPTQLIADHVAAGVDRSVVLTVAPSDYTEYGLRGTVDLLGETSVPGPPSIDLANDYIAALAQTEEHLIGVAAVNPVYRGVDEACRELHRAVEELGLVALKLLPMYDRYAFDDRSVTERVFETAQDLGVPVMVHMGTSSARDTVLEYANPIAVDSVARLFPELPILICHAGFPWLDESLVVASRHENVYMDVSNFISRCSQTEIYRFLQRAVQLDCSWSRICWGTDYPGAGSPLELLPKFALAGEVDGAGQIPDSDMARMLGGNWARFVGMSDWSEDQTIEEIEGRRSLWRRLWASHGPSTDVPR